MDFIDRYGSIEGVGLASRFHPRFVTPVMFKVPDDGRGIRRLLGIHGKGIALIDTVSTMFGNDMILVDGTEADPRHKTFPDAGGILSDLQAMRCFVPIVEVANDGDLLRVRRPYRKVGPFDAVQVDPVRAQFVGEREMIALFEQVYVVFGQETPCIHNVIASSHVLLQCDSLSPPGSFATFRWSWHQHPESPPVHPAVAIAARCDGL